MSHSEPDTVTFKIAPAFSWKKLASGAIVLDLEKGEFFTLNDTAALIWEGFVAGKDKGAIVSSIVAAYEVSEGEARQDMDEVIGLLVREGVLVTDGP